MASLQVRHGDDHLPQVVSAADSSNQTQRKLRFDANLAKARRCMDDESLCSELTDELLSGRPNDDCFTISQTGTSEPGSCISFPQGTDAKRYWESSNWVRPRSRHCTVTGDESTQQFPCVSPTRSHLSTRSDTTGYSSNRSLQSAQSTWSASSQRSGRGQRLLGEIMTLQSVRACPGSIPAKHTCVPEICVLGTCAIDPAPFDAFTHPSCRFTRCPRRYAPLPGRPQLTMPAVPGVSHPQHLTLQGMPRGTAKTLEALAETQYLRGRLLHHGHNGAAHGMKGHPHGGRGFVAPVGFRSRSSTAELVAEAVATAVAHSTVFIPSPTAVRSRLVSRFGDDSSVNSELSGLHQQAQR
jgi:hypothetical protein